MPVEYRCYCSDERVEKVLVSLGREELIKLAEEQENFEVTCQFCDRRYWFSREKLIDLAGGK